MQNLEDVTRTHTAIVGITGSGKTHLARHLHRHTPRVSIFWNPQDEPGVVGHTVERWDARLLEEHRKLNIVPPDEDTYVEDLEACRVDLFAIGKSIQTGRGRPPQWCVVWADEAHEVAPEGSSRTTPLHTLCKRGRRHGLAVVPITQAPADLSKGVLKQCSTHVVFRIGRFERTYFEIYDLPVEPGQLKGHQFVIATEEEVHGPYTL